MSPRELVAALENVHGVRFRVVNGRIDIEAASEPPRELLDALTREKAAVLAFLIERERPAVPVTVTDRREAEPAPPGATAAPEQPIRLAAWQERAWREMQERLSREPGAVTATRWGN